MFVLGPQQVLDMVKDLSEEILGLDDPDVSEVGGPVAEAAYQTNLIILPPLPVQDIWINSSFGFVCQSTDLCPPISVSGPFIVYKLQVHGQSLTERTRSTPSCHNQH